MSSTVPILLKSALWVLIVKIRRGICAQVFLQCNMLEKVRGAARSWLEEPETKLRIHSGTSRLYIGRLFIWNLTYIAGFDFVQA